MSLKNVLRTCYDENNLYEVGVDEAGAGPLMGPVVAAAVVLSNERSNELRDSKKLSEKKRNELQQYIRDNAEDYAIAFVDEREIDEINILNARIKAMNKAIGKLKLIDFIDLTLIDGNRFYPQWDMPYKTIIGGDDLYKSISAASILAKYERDKYIVKLHDEYPMYEWNKNKGYGTKNHIAAIKKYGITPYHRKTFLTRII